MAKTTLTVKAECLTANKTKAGSQITLAVGVQQTQPGQATAKTVVSINVPDQSAADSFTPGKTYTVTVSE